jgi:uncharacterized protein (TIRG00374 family)
LRKAPEARNLSASSQPAILATPQRAAGLTRRHVRWAILGALISLGCIALLWRQVDLRQSWHALGKLDLRFLMLTLVLFLINLPLRAWRWQRIFPVAARPSFASCFTVLGIGNMANFLLPGRAGDLARCALVGRETSASETSRTLATLAVEKVLDGLALAAMVLFSVWWLHPPYWVVDLLRVALLVFGGALLALIVLRHRAGLLIELFRRAFVWLRLPSIEEKVDPLLISFADGLSAVGSLGQMLFLFALTAAIWACEAGLIWLLAAALGLSIKLESAAVASAILGLAFMIPAAPGGLGTYELFGTAALKLAGLAASGALALTVVIHAWVFVVNVAAGILLLAAKGLSLAQLKNRLSGSQIESGGSPVPPSI